MDGTAAAGVRRRHGAGRRCRRSTGTATAGTDRRGRRSRSSSVRTHRPGIGREGRRGPLPGSAPAAAGARPTRQRQRSRGDGTHVAEALSIGIDSAYDRSYVRPRYRPMTGAFVMNRRIAVISDAASYVGPELARVLASRGHDLVLGDPVDGLAAELESLGAAVETVTGVRDLAQPGSSERLVQAAMDRFGRIDSAAAFTGRIVVGRFLRSTLDDMRAALTGCVEAPYNFLRAVIPVMVEQREGQALVFTSAAGGRPTPGAPLYSSARAGANMLVRNVAAEVADRGVQVNAIGTNFMDFPEFLKANRAEDAEGRARVEAMVPMGRLGALDELAHFAAAFVDGTSRFATGQFVAFAGGWA